MNRLPLVALVALAVSLLALATFSLSPVLMGGGAIDYNDFFWFILASLAGTVASFAWLAFARARPTREWLVSLGLVAGWCLVIGLLTLLTNYMGRAHWAESLQVAEERAEQLRGPGTADSKGEALPPNYVREQLDDADDDIKQSREHRDYKQTSVYLSLAMLLVGLVSAAKFAQLYRQREIA